MKLSSLSPTARVAVVFLRDGKPTGVTQETSAHTASALCGADAEVTPISAPVAGHATHSVPAESAKRKPAVFRTAPARPGHVAVIGPAKKGKTQASADLARTHGARFVNPNAKKKTQASKKKR